MYTGLILIRPLAQGDLLRPTSACRRRSWVQSAGTGPAPSLTGVIQAKRDTWTFPLPCRSLADPSTAPCTDPAQPGPRLDGCAEPEWGAAPRAWESLPLPRQSAFPLMHSLLTQGHQDGGAGVSEFPALPFPLPLRTSRPHSARGAASD